MARTFLGALVAALCQDSVLKLVRVHDKNSDSCIIFIIFTSPKHGGDQRSMGIDHVCVVECVCLKCQCFTIITYLYYIHN